ncbi:hypothetical protein STAS_06783 [Striga asiatica]|uniref:Uncharacterized protein n=1 Tax=Striga asiatica TaxID=4170 RepID=A0A5A7PD14_STRAF|nr:hypothetical protein STAS_06783 [Striga asiatica]
MMLQDIVIHEKQPAGHALASGLKSKRFSAAAFYQIQAPYSPYDYQRTHKSSKLELHLLHILHNPPLQSPSQLTDRKKYDSDLQPSYSGWWPVEVKDNGRPFFHHMNGCKTTYIVFVWHANRLISREFQGFLEFQEKTSQRSHTYRP